MECARRVRAKWAASWGRRGTGISGPGSPPPLPGGEGVDFWPAIGFGTRESPPTEIPHSLTGRHHPFSSDSTPFSSRPPHQTTLGPRPLRGRGPIHSHRKVHPPPSFAGRPDSSWRRLSYRPILRNKRLFRASIGVPRRRILWRTMCERTSVSPVVVQCPAEAESGDSRDCRRALAGSASGPGHTIDRWAKRELGSAGEGKSSTGSGWALPRTRRAEGGGVWLFRGVAAGAPGLVGDKRGASGP